MSNLDTFTPKWQRAIWIGVATSLAVMCLLLIIFVGLTISKVTNIITSNANADLTFVFASISLITLTLLRLLAILTGTAVVFAGLAVSFFAHAEATKISAQSSNSSSLIPKATLATHSPGIAAVVVGSIIIISALYAKSNHEYEGPQTYTVTLPTGQANEAPIKSELGIHKSNDLVHQVRPLNEVLGHN